MVKRRKYFKNSVLSSLFKPYHKNANFFEKNESDENISIFLSTNIF
jgi:hypothetical protein